MSDKKNHPLFVIDADGPVKWPVLVRIPADGGEFALFQFTGVFKRMSEDEYEAIMASRKETLPEIGTDEQVELIAGKSRAEILEGNAKLFPQLMTGWEDVRDATGTEVAFTEAVLHKQITGVNGMHLSIGLWMAINEIRSGARLGN